MWVERMMICDENIPSFAASRHIFYGLGTRSKTEGSNNFKAEILKELKEGRRSDMDWVRNEVMEHGKKRVDVLIETIEEKAREI